jgi:hypothetical protein
MDITVEFDGMVETVPKQIVSENGTSKTTQ